MSGSDLSRISFLNVPEAPSEAFPRNFIKVAVCELRFPTLLEVPQSAVRALNHRARKIYPNYDSLQSVQVLPTSGKPGPPTTEHRWSTRDTGWAITLKPAAVSVETTRYPGFEQFSDRVVSVMNWVGPEIDSNFFTRVGLRYVNEIEVGDSDSVHGLVRDALIQPLIDGAYGTVSAYRHEIHGFVPDGQYVFRHGMAPQGRAYLLDFDFYAENVEVNETASLIAHFHERAFSFFSWCLGPDSLTYLRNSPHDGGS